MGRLGQVFGRNVRRLRQDRGLSQEALADAVGLAVTYVGQIERGRRNPTLNVVERFAEALTVDPLDLLEAPAAEDGVSG
ncbi:helix-turn-helix transcriptional regulator [uncultured Phenylobacterium sp.]|jgi:transcriptional regulator with XRE-family HTH domain|uniref:helix-turn-helix domain-containing protein n=1 Tax=uncultured Phenylobacterium sp. TaxID=349273 RepID=UPI0025E0662F|nr:helix-turn-helix transcriptional regulator [uncultured Phenylobacterium sp.]